MDCPPWNAAGDEHNAKDAPPLFSSLCHDDDFIASSRLYIFCCSVLVLIVKMRMQFVFIFVLVTTMLENEKFNSYFHGMRVCVCL